MYEGFSCDKSLKDKGFNYLLHHMTQLFSLRASGISHSKSQDATKNNILNCDESPEDHFCPFLKLYFFCLIMIYLYSTSITKVSDLITPKMSILSTSKTTPYSRIFSRAELLAYLLLKWRVLASLRLHS